MKPVRSERGLYAIIQYCPDPSRLESANIGVLLYCHARSFCKVKMSDNHRRVERFFGLHSACVLDGIYLAKQSMIDRIDVESPAWLACSEYEGRSGLIKFAGLLANQILMPPPRSMRVGNPQKDLDQLYRDLVMAPERNSP